MATRRPGGAYVRLWDHSRAEAQSPHNSRNAITRRQNRLKIRLNQVSRKSASIRLWSSCLSIEYLYSRMSCSIELGIIVLTHKRPKPESCFSPAACFMSLTKRKSFGDTTHSSRPENACPRHFATSPNRDGVRGRLFVALWPLKTKMKRTETTQTTETERKRTKRITQFVKSLLKLLRPCCKSSPSRTAPRPQGVQ